MMELTCITVDCADPERVANFWNEALGWGGVAVGADGAICGPSSGGAYLEFVPVPDNLVLCNIEGNEFCLGGGEFSE